jgi:DNA-binding transcriptional ArsR family regulator
MDDEVFRALADPSRRRLLDLLNARNGQTLRELCAELDMARQSVSKHLAVLESANLVSTVWRGREKLHHLNAEPINAIADRWIHQYDRRRVQLFADLKTALEAEMSENDFVYTTYIRTTPERLWQALTDPAFTEQYWQLHHETDWKPGSPMVWHQGDVAISGPGQVRRAHAVHAAVLRLAPHHARVREGGRVRRGDVRADQPGAVVDGNVRARAGRRPGEADRDPQRLRTGQHDPDHDSGRLAAPARGPEILCGDLSRRCALGVAHAPSEHRDRLHRRPGVG